MSHQTADTRVRTPGEITSYEVQFTIAVDNPVNNITRKRGKRGYIFYVPINHPLAHNAGYQYLTEAARVNEKPVLSTPLNNRESV